MVQPRLEKSCEASVSDERFLAELGRAVSRYHNHSRLLVTVPVGASRTPPRHIKQQKPPGLVWDAPTLIGRVTLFTYSLEPGEAWDSQPEKHVARVRKTLAKWLAAGMVGLIVDLRNHHGGSYRPGLHALGGLLLHGSPLMRWVGSPTATGMWGKDTLVYYDGAKEQHFKWKPSSASRAQRERASAPVPVAVLVGPGTASSGEILASCFQGKPRMRSFGAATAGGLSVNQGWFVGPGIELLLTIRLVCTMDGLCHMDERLMPDRLTKDPLGEAIVWLGAMAKHPQASYSGGFGGEI